MRIYDIIDSPEFRRNVVIVPFRPALRWYERLVVPALLLGCVVVDLILGLLVWQHIALWFALHRSGAL